MVGGVGGRTRSPEYSYSLQTTRDIDSERENVVYVVDRCDAKPKKADVADEGDTRALETARAALAWLRRTFASMAICESEKEKIAQMKKTLPALVLACRLHCLFGFRAVAQRLALLCITVLCFPNPPSYR